MSRLRILHTIPSLARVHGGPTRALLMMEAVLSGIAEITILTTDDDGPGRRLAKSIQVAPGDRAKRVYVRKWFEFYKIAPGLVPWLLRHVNCFDVVHIHALFSFSSVASALIARLRGVPYVVRPLGTLANYGISQRRPLLKRLSLAFIEGPILRHAAALHFTSESERDEARALGVPIRCVVIPLGIDAGEWPVHKEQTTGSELRILFLSRLDPKKNLESLFQAFALLDRTTIQARLTVAGSGSADYTARLHGVADRLGISDRVDWLGHIEGVQKAEVLARAEVFVLPSRSENFGIAAAEAMLAGVPCVLSRGVAIASDAEAAGAAVVIEPEPEAIADALRGILAARPQAQELGARGRKFAQREYSAATMGLRLAALYSDIKAGRLPERA